MSSALTETKTRGQPDRPVKVCDALGPSGRAWLRTRLICGGCSAAAVKREKQGYSSAAAMHVCVEGKYGNINRTIRRGACLHLGQQEAAQALL